MLLISLRRQLLALSSMHRMTIIISASIDYRPSRAREGLATFRRTALDI
jgi:hypothetical protein